MRRSGPQSEANKAKGHHDASGEQGAVKSLCAQPPAASTAAISTPPAIILEIRVISFPRQ